MANSKITDLTSGNPAQSGDEIPINRSGSDFKLTAGSIAALAAPAGSDTQIQFNSGSAFAGAASGNFFTYNDNGPLGAYGANNPSLMLGTSDSAGLATFYVWGGSTDPNSADANQEVLYFNSSVGSGAAFTYGGFATQGLQFRSYHDFFAEDAFQPILFVGDPVVFTTNFSTFNNDVAFATAKVKLASGIPLGWASTTNAQTGTLDLILTRKAAATLHLGDVDAAAPVAQTLGVQSVVAGTSNTAGADFTIAGSQGTGTGAGGSVIFNLAAAGGSGTSQNALARKYAFTSAGKLEGDTSNPFISLTNAAGGQIGYSSTSVLCGSSNITLTRSAQLVISNGSQSFRITTPAANDKMQLGAADAASPVAQTLSVQNVVAGTSNTAGADFTIAGSQGTGTGAPGNIIFKLASAGTTGTSQNSLVQYLELNNATSAQPLLRLYSNFTDTSNYARLSIGYISTNAGFGIKREAAGTGGSGGQLTYQTSAFSNAHVFYGGSTQFGSFGNQSFSINTGGSFNINSDVYLRRVGAANWAFGNTDAAAPVAQTLSVQNVVAGTSNTAGTDFTLAMSQGTGTGAGGGFILKVAPAGTTGTSQNALAQVFKIDSTSSITGGVNQVEYAIGTVSSGTTTPVPANGAMQTMTNGGASTIAPGSVLGYYLLTITNNASAGALTTSGWTKVSGDAFDTTNGHIFRCSCSIGAGGSLMVVQAMQ